MECFLKILKVGWLSVCARFCARRARKEKWPLPLRNVVERIRTLTYKQTRGLGADTQRLGLQPARRAGGAPTWAQMRWTALPGRLRTAAHSVPCVKAPGQSGRRSWYESRPLHSPCHTETNGHPSHKGAFLPQSMHPQGSNRPVTVSPICMRAPAASQGPVSAGWERGSAGRTADRTPTVLTRTGGLELQGEASLGRALGTRADASGSTGLL